FLFQVVIRRWPLLVAFFFFLFPAVNRDGRLRLCARQRRETYGDACFQRGSHGREPSVDRPLRQYAELSRSRRSAKPGAVEERNAQGTRLRRALHPAELYPRNVGGPLRPGGIAC